MIKSRRTSRLVAATTAAAAALAVSGVAVAGVASSTGTNAPRQARTSLAYTCRFPSGTQQVGVRVAAKFPAAGAVGQAIQPTGVHMTITVPRTALGNLSKLGATTIGGSASLGVTVAEGGTSASAAWRVAAGRPTPLPATGSLVMAASGAVPPATASVPGELTFTAEGLVLVFAPRRAAGAATSPATLTVACNPDPAQDARLAAIPVPASAPTPAASSSQPHAEQPRIAIGRTPRGSESRAAPSCFIKVPITFIGSAFIAGFSNVRKLQEASLLGPGPNNRPRAGLSDLNILYSIINVCTSHFYQYTIGQLNYHGKPQFPPAVSTFLDFRFMPVTATLEVTQIPVQCRDITGHLIGRTDLCIILSQRLASPGHPCPCQYAVTATSGVQIRAHNVMVNGVPLNVGRHCQTAKPTTLTLKANSSAGYSVLTGGVLSGFVTVPSFTGCGIGENLDPLLNASVSGSGNFVKMTQGPTCAKALPAGPVNGNCRIPPGPGHKYGVPKYYPKVQH